MIANYCAIRRTAAGRHGWAKEPASLIMLSFSQRETFAHLIYWYVAVEPETAAVY
jgi:hypothetical protein